MPMWVTAMVAEKWMQFSNKKVDYIHLMMDFDFPFFVRREDGENYGAMEESSDEKYRFPENPLVD